MENGETLAPTIPVNTEPLITKRKTHYRFIFLSVICIILLFGFFGIYFSYNGLKQLPVVSSTPPDFAKETSQAVDSQIALLMQHTMPWTIPNTNLVLQLPDGAKPSTENFTYGISDKNAKELLGNYFYANVARPLPLDFYVWATPTALTPAEWILDNTEGQGKTEREWLKEYPNQKIPGENITLNNWHFYADNFGCCGAYEATYMLQVKGLNNQPLIIGFAAHNSLISAGSEKNKLLDAILNTLHVE